MCMSTCLQVHVCANVLREQTVHPSPLSTLGSIFLCVCARVRVCVPAVCLCICVCSCCVFVHMCVCTCAPSSIFLLVCLLQAPRMPCPLKWKALQARPTLPCAGWQGCQGCLLLTLSGEQACRGP